MSGRVECPECGRTAVATLAVDVVGTGGLDVSEGVETCALRDDGRWRVYLHRERRWLSTLLD